MKKLILILSLSILSGCAGTQIKHLNSSEFQKQTELIEKLNSATKTICIGKSDSRIYLVYYTAITSFGKGKTIVYWTELSNLSESQIKRIMNYRSPFTKEKY